MTRTNITVNRDFLEDTRFSINDRNEQYTDEGFIQMLINRVRCLSCDHYFPWRPGFWGSTEGRCWNCDVEYFISEEEKNENISLNVDNQILNSKILDSKQVETIIGKPKLNWKDIPINRELNTRNLELTISDVDNNKITGGVGINVGNPHVIFFVNDLELFDLKKIGPQIENNEIFPEKCNVTLAQKISNENIKIKVWERGAGLTKACGTAACATAVAANIDELENTVTEIEFKLGRLQIKIDQDKFIHMKGPVSEIQKITIKL